jgi:hypothetical protein
MGGALVVVLWLIAGGAATVAIGMADLATMKVEDDNG